LKLDSQVLINRIAASLQTRRQCPIVRILNAGRRRLGVRLLLPFLPPCLAAVDSTSGSNHCCTGGRQNSLPPTVNSYFVVSGLVAKQARKQKAAQTATAHQAASDQQAGESVLITTSIFLVIVLVFFSLFGSAAKQVRQQETAQTAAA
jgi:hypothetical protein